MREPILAVVVPALDAEATIGPCLDGLARARSASPGPVELVVVDNGSRDRTCALVEARLHEAGRLVRCPGVSISALRNAGARLTTAGTIAFIDAACVVDASHHVAALQVLASTGAAATGATYALPGEPAWVEAVWDALHRHPATQDVHFLNSGNLVVRRAAFDEVGGFTESLLTGEDTDFGKKLGRAGHRIREDARVRAVHLGNPKTLPAFFRKQVWHGASSLDIHFTLATAVTLAYMGGLAAALVVPWLDLSPGTRLAVAALAVNAVPAAAIAGRLRRGGRMLDPIRPFLVWHAYFLGRSWAVVKRLAAARITRG